MKKLFLILTVILLVGVGCTQTTKQNKNIKTETKEKICDNLTNVKSITVNNNAIDIEFTPNGSFQVIGRKTKFGTTDSFEYGTKFTVANRDNIYWGDGDHAFNYLIVTDVKDSTAYINFKNEFYWNGETTGNTENCVIQSSFTE